MYKIILFIVKLNKSFLAYLVKF